MFLLISHVSPLITFLIKFELICFFFFVLVFINFMLNKNAPSWIKFNFEIFLLIISTRRDKNVVETEISFFKLNSRLFLLFASSANL